MCIYVMSVVAYNPRGVLSRGARYYIPRAAFGVLTAAHTFNQGYKALMNYMGPSTPTYKVAKAIYVKAYMKSKSVPAPMSRVRASYKPFPKKIKQQLKEVKKLAEADMGTLTYRDIETSQLLASSNSQGVVSYVGNSTEAIEEVIAQLRYYNPSSPSTLVTADGATGAYQKEFYISRAYSKITCRNNFQVPAHVSIYICVPKQDTSITPTTAWSNGLTDSSNGTTSNINSFPTDSLQFTDLWRIQKTRKKVVQPGSTWSLNHSVKPFSYDPSLIDDHSFSYQRLFRGWSYLVVVQGVCGHDSTTTTTTGILQAGVDFVVERTFEVRYNAGADIKYTYYASALGTLTTGGVVSQKPVADNQKYSDT